MSNSHSYVSNKISIFCYGEMFEHFIYSFISSTLQLRTQVSKSWQYITLKVNEMESRWDRKTKRRTKKLWMDNTVYFIERCRWMCHQLCPDGKNTGGPREEQIKEDADTCTRIFFIKTRFVYHREVKDIFK